MSSLSLETIREASAIGCAPDAPSVVDSLLDARWTTSSALEHAFTALSESSDEYVAAAHFQLPFDVRLPARWRRLPDGRDQPFVLFLPDDALEPSVHTSRLAKYAHLPAPPRAVRTHVILSLPVTGTEREFYPRYVETLSRPHHRSEGVARGRTGRVIPFAEYQLRLVRALRNSAYAWLEHFLPRYSVACRDPHAILPARLPCFFLMWQNGHITLPLREQRREATPQRQQEERRANFTWKPVDRWLRRKQAPTPYERAIVEAVRLIELKHNNLAVALVVSTLEWLFDNLVEHRVVKPLKSALSEQPGLLGAVIGAVTDDDAMIPAASRRHINWRDRRERLLPAAHVELPESINKDLTWLLELRNSSVHDIATSIADADALRAVEVGLAIVSEALDPIRE